MFSVRRERERESWQRRPSPSIRSARSPHSKISLWERGTGRTLWLMMLRQRVAECRASGERTRGDIWVRTQERERGGGWWKWLWSQRSVIGWNETTPEFDWENGFAKFLFECFLKSLMVILRLIASVPGRRLLGRLSSNYRNTTPMINKLLFFFKNMNSYKIMFPQRFTSRYHGVETMRYLFTKKI